MRSGDLDRSLEPVVRGTEVNHRSRAETDIINVCTCVSYTLQQVFVDLIGRYSAVASYQNFICLKQLGDEISYLVSCVLIEIHIVDSAYVICMKCSHNYFNLVL